MTYPVSKDSHPELFDKMKSEALALPEYLERRGIDPLMGLSIMAMALTYTAQKAGVHKGTFLIMLSEQWDWNMTPGCARCHERAVPERGQLCSECAKL